APVLEPSGITIGKYKALIRSLKTRSIGIGGDSLVRVENNGKLLIGPERVGPAMAYGGKSPTPTDALCVLGRIKNGDLEKAETGMAEIGEKLGISTEKAAMEVFNLACRTIVEEAMAMIDRINSKPVYTVHELQEGYKVDPKRFLVLGGPAPWFAEHIDSSPDFQFNAVAIPSWQVANAIGAALARTTCEVTLFADTEQGIAKAPEENFHAYVDKEFSSKKAVEQAFELLKQKAIQIGSDDSDPETEVIESQQFNMVRGFYTTGRNIRVKVQVKPGLIHEYEAIATALKNAKGSG
ncbi:hydantoinase/oxoprolinase family protein, partial [Desulfobacterales bacterium HSG16]|nr:hydantoinase/oxoprolinase family protein [Desulfobacterales bacterium HSG16]